MSDYGEQCADTDGMAKRYADEWAKEELSATTHAPMPGNAIAIGLLQARIARKEAANEALFAKIEATMADMRSLQRQNENWRAECQRLSALLVETQQQLAQRMAMPANALRHGGVR